MSVEKESWAYKVSQHGLEKPTEMKKIREIPSWWDFIVFDPEVATRIPRCL